MKRNRWLAIAVVFLLLIAMTACSGNSSSQDDSDQAAEESAADSAYEVFIHTEGNGEVTYTDPDGDSFTGQDNFFRAAENDVYELEAVPGDGYKFVNWTMDGAEYSSEINITLTVTENLELTAVFEAE